MEIKADEKLPPRRAEYLKYIYLCGDVVKTTEISRHFSVMPSTITKTLAGMAEQGLVRHTPYHGVSLTRRGEAHARFLLRRHRIIALLLSRNGLSPAEACTEARAFESYVSRGVVDRICASMGHPVMSVCGRIEHDTGCCPEWRGRMDDGR